MRYFIEISYKGTRYSGWQIQPHAESIQESIQKALSLILKTPVKITGAGRTDAGVHAKQMFTHFDINNEIDTGSLINKLNSFLAPDIAIHHIFKVPDEAHARFDALSRSYEYHIHTAKNPFLQEASWYFKKDLDIKKMNEAARILLKYEDFKSFSKSKTDVKTYKCDIKEAFWEEKENAYIFHITADRFLRNMVRAIVGTLIEVGTGKMSPADFEEVIKKRDRTQAGFSVPGHGLYLTKIEYPTKIMNYGND